ncbi:DNA cytosine methyltransferase [Bacillus sp. JCM 19034]|uniref:DNA cytosine methyltransferase n=1 Tax=Bacillus sp. JCM 19034 TaxID=1481928 RepID=UPI0007850430|nr:DNA (cytosine-5-)-methyltransferase [Bacillus sp. JCM 19034]
MKSIELFAGIGGISLAAEWAGIETIAFCERDKFCQKVLRKHWPDVPIFDDVRTLNKQTLNDRGVDVGAIELITGGFPCQPYSIAGKRKGKEDDRDLWPEMFRIIEEIRPTWVVGENVANFVNMELDRTLFDLESIGYKGRAFVIPACAVEAMHERKRTFVVAHSFCKRWRGLDKNSKKNGSRKFEQISVHPKNESGSWDKEINILFAGAELLANPSGRVLRNDDGLSEGVDRLRALGNAVIPQQIYPLLKTIVDIEIH